MVVGPSRVQFGRSIIKRAINKIQRPRSGRPIFLSRVWLQTELDDTRSCYQLIKTMTKLEKETRHRLYVSLKKKKKQKKSSQLGKMRDSSGRAWRVLSTYTSMTCYLSLQLSYFTVNLQAWRLRCPNGAQIMFENSVRVLIKYKIQAYAET